MRDCPQIWRPKPTAQRSQPYVEPHFGAQNSQRWWEVMRWSRPFDWPVSPPQAPRFPRMRSVRSSCSSAQAYTIIISIQFILCRINFSLTLADDFGLRIHRDETSPSLEFWELKPAPRTGADMSGSLNTQLLRTSLYSLCRKIGGNVFQNDAAN